MFPKWISLVDSEPFIERAIIYPLFCCTHFSPTNHKSVSGELSSVLSVTLLFHVSLFLYPFMLS